MMESFPRSLNLQQAFQTELNFDKYARQILENSKTKISTVTTPTKITDFLQGFGATFINSIQLQNFENLNLHSNQNSGTSAGASANPSPSPNESSNEFSKFVKFPKFDFNSSSIVSTTTANIIKNSTEMEIEFIPNHIIIDSPSLETMDQLQKQLEYDKFMNEVWIGIVLTLILISMVFCICSCFLYHQFRTWKRNYHNTVVQVNTNDIESVKLESDLDDPVPEYTLVSGLPSYEAAMELMHKTPMSNAGNPACFIVYPSVYNVFNKNERTTTTTTTIQPMQSTDATNQHQEQQQNNFSDSSITTPLLHCGNPNSIPNSKSNENIENENCSNDLTDNLGLTVAASQMINKKELLVLLNESANTASTANTATNTHISATKSLEEVIIVKNDKRK